VSDRVSRFEQKKTEKKDIKEIKKMISHFTNLANKHDLDALKPLYADSYMNNDGFDREVYFKNVKETWDECSDITYKIKILSIDMEGAFANVTIEENATGTVFENMELGPAAGEIHSRSKEIYHLAKVNDQWLIAGETVLSDESSLLYGDARFMNINLVSPSQVSASEEYTVSVKVETDKDAYIVGSISQDPVTYPSVVSEPPLRVFPNSQILERVLKANSDNLNEYAVASLAISKTEHVGIDRMRVYMAGLACLMKRVNVIPKNNFVNAEEEEDENSNM
jgi:ketosteroid isomerase-like protein